jgi:hypothetical protein
MQQLTLLMPAKLKSGVDIGCDGYHPIEAPATRSNAAMEARSGSRRPKVELTITLFIWMFKLQN